MPCPSISFRRRPCLGVPVRGCVACPLLSKCPETYWRICQLTGHKQFVSSREFDDENRLINEVMALIDRADKLAYLAAGKDAFAGAEGLSSVGYRLHVSGYSGITVSLCRIWNSK